MSTPVYVVPPPVYVVQCSRVDHFEMVVSAGSADEAVELASEVPLGDDGWEIVGGGISEM